MGGLTADQESVASSAYPGAASKVQKKTAADEALKRATEMASAMAWLTSPATSEVESDSDEEEDKDEAKEVNWWEQGDELSVDDEVSMFSNQTEFKTEDMPDLMSLLKSKQDDEKEEGGKSKPDKKAKGKKVKGRKGKAAKQSVGAQEAEQRTKKMAEAMNWWKDAHKQDVKSSGDVDVDMDDGVGDMKRVVEWWSMHRDYKPPSSKEFDPDVKKALKVTKALDGWDKAGLEAENRSKGLQDALSWWEKQGDVHVEDMKEFEKEQSTFKRVNDLFGGWELKGTPDQEWEKFDPRKDVARAQKLAKDLGGCLDLLLLGDFEDSEPINRLKDVMVDWRFKSDNSAKDLDAALNWWIMNSESYDPLKASTEDEEMFEKARLLLAQFGLKEGDPLDKRSKDMKDALALWAKYKDSPIEKLTPHQAEQMKKVKHALLQIRRNGLKEDDMRFMSAEMKQLMDWYRSDGFKLDVDRANKEEVEKFKKAKGLLTLWNYKIDPTPAQLKDIADSLISLRRKGYDPAVFDMYEGEEAEKFQRLQKAMVDWRLGSADSNDLYPEQAENTAKDIEDALTWWRDNGENFKPSKATKEQMFLAEKVKGIMDVWKPRQATQSFTWMRSQKPSKEMQDAIDLLREHGMHFDVEKMNITPQERADLIKLKDAMMEWRRMNASNLSPKESEETVKDMINAMNWWKKKGKDYDAVDARLDAVPAMMRQKQVMDTLAEWHRDLGIPEHAFAHLSRKEVKKTAKEMDKAMTWWKRNGKNIDVEKAMEDEQKFLKAQRLAQWWQKYDMSEEDREAIADEVESLLRWGRSTGKNFDKFEDVDDDELEKANKVKQIFALWDTKSSKKKAIAKDIEDALSWWRQKEFSVDPEGLMAMDMEKMKKLEIFAQKVSELTQPGDSADWFRNQDLPLDLDLAKDMNDTFNWFDSKEQKPAKVEGIKKKGGPMTDEEKRAKEMSSALDWLRNNEEDIDSEDENSVAAMSIATFKKIDAMPSSASESEPTQLGSALDWLRQKTMGGEDDEDFKKAGSASAKKKGGKGSEGDSGLAAGLNWLRSQQDDSESDDDDEDGAGGKVGGISAKPKTEAEKRAADMANALDCKCHAF